MPTLLICVGFIVLLYENSKQRNALPDSLQIFMEISWSIDGNEHTWWNLNEMNKTEQNSHNPHNQCNQCKREFSLATL